ncbi:hypothetical protein PSAC2689_90342 [Paraburkholderia sacchari]|uniref:hypothetical protein n=1 Tax=Paraburkholderia sacchari TaxID=159450 RepID=UPI0039A58CC2
MSNSSSNHSVRNEALCRAFDRCLDELRQSHADVLPPAKPMSSRAAGVEHAVSLLCRWQERGEAGMQAAEPILELLTALTSCSGPARDGLLQTIGAFLLLTLEGAPPIVHGWDAEREIEYWGVPFADEEGNAHA